MEERRFLPTLNCWVSSPDNVMKTQINSIDETISRVSRQDTAASNQDYMPKNRNYQKSCYMREMQIKFLDKYFGLPGKGDPRRKQYIEAILYN
ncbi:hypothetical protein KY342_00345 [Candidatus Woesearchaeota archaeon]|nr:hypothetical protein [Candidatus Woesearchaeota archaeon]